VALPVEESLDPIPVRAAPQKFAFSYWEGGSVFVDYVNALLYYTREGRYILRDGCIIDFNHRNIVIIRLQFLTDVTTTR